MDFPMRLETRLGGSRSIRVATNFHHGQHVQSVPTQMEKEKVSKRTSATDFDKLEIDREDLARRFWAKVDRRGPDECWPWLGASYKRKKLVYGYINQRVGPRKAGKTIKLAAHRLAVWLTAGVLDVFDLVLHSCHNAWCVNPAHLKAGTHEENMTEMVAAGRSLKGKRKAA